MKDLERELDLLADKNQAEILKRFFKTKKGQYGEGDIFLGIQVPVLRKLAKKYFAIDHETALLLLKSPVHEKRMLALFILVNKFEKGGHDIRETIFNSYLENTRHINNWDLVDLSADKIVGAYLYGKNTDVLLNLAESEILWEKRIAIISTFNFIKKQRHELTLQIAEILLNDKHDLIHKAVGWMLREVGKRISVNILLQFLNQNYKTMPRTMLRYAIEKLPRDLRLDYLKGKI
ncbi:MAG: DNA alkylation repair protein [Actinobacteria bacterium]|nr:DNA alkylation repair protein [Actinomycetota bacterium]